jgi:peroxiredoxin (alkyl hydroperoxide reductase subunit C)
MSVLVGKEAPNFKTNCAIKNEVKEINLKDFRGKYVILFFYPLDFTFVCPTELHAFQEKLDEFTKSDCVVLGCSVDSHFSHLAWLNTPKEKGGIQGVSYGLLADLGGRIASSYDVLNPDGIAYRGLFLIDREGVVRHQIVNDLPLGRSVDEALRMLQALQHTEKHGEVCPANWAQGSRAIQTTTESVAEYLLAANG